MMTKPVICPTCKQDMCKPPREGNSKKDCPQCGHGLSRTRAKRVFKVRAEVERLNQWINDLQSGMYINCVYCGHRYGPNKNNPVAMSQVLYDHIKQCPKHPLTAERERVKKLREYTGHKNYCHAVTHSIVTLQVCNCGYEQAITDTADKEDK